MITLNNLTKPLSRRLKCFLGKNEKSVKMPALGRFFHNYKSNLLNRATFPGPTIKRVPLYKTLVVRFIDCIMLETPNFKFVLLECQQESHFL